MNKKFKKNLKKKRIAHKAFLHDKRIVDKLRKYVITEIDKSFIRDTISDRCCLDTSVDKILLEIPEMQFDQDNLIVVKDFHDHVMKSTPIKPGKSWFALMSLFNAMMGDLKGGNDELEEAPQAAEDCGKEDEWPTSEEAPSLQ